MDDLARARAVFERDIFADGVVGCRIDAVRDGWARCSLQLETRHRNGVGTPMGGVLFTLADFAFAVASNFDRDVFVSDSAETHFLTPAQGELLTAEAVQVHSGRQTCLFRIDITDEKRTHVARFMIHGMKIKERSRGTEILRPQ